MDSTLTGPAYFTVGDLRTWLERRFGVNLNDVRRLEIVGSLNVPRGARYDQAQVFLRIERYVKDAAGRRFAIRAESGQSVVAMEHLLVPIVDMPGEVTHACPRNGDATMPCCGLSPTEVPSTDRMTDVPANVTCGTT